MEIMGVNSSYKPKSSSKPTPPVLWAHTEERSWGSDLFLACSFLHQRWPKSAEKLNSPSIHQTDGGLTNSESKAWENFGVCWSQKLQTGNEWAKFSLRQVT